MLISGGVRKAGPKRVKREEAKGLRLESNPGCCSTAELNWHL